MSRLAAKLYPLYCKKFDYTIKNYEIELNVDTKRRTFICTTSISLTSDSNTRRFYFLLSRQFELESVNYLGITLYHSEKNWQSGITEIMALLPRKVNVGEKLVLSFKYSGMVQSNDSFEFNPLDYWYPFSPVPQKYSTNLKVITPTSMRMAGPGKYLREEPADTRVSNLWTTNQHISHGIHLVAGDYYKTSRDNNPTMDIYYPKSYMNQGQTIARHTEKVLDFLTDYLGPAPTQTGSIVIRVNPESIIKSSFYITSISTGFLDQLKEFPTSKERSMRLYWIMARELSNRCLKYNLTVNHPRDAWYLDGIAEYLSWLALEHEYSDKALKEVLLVTKEQVTESKTSILKGADGILGEFPQWLISKAGWIMRIAHCLAGESVLDSFRQLYSTSPHPAPTPQEFFNGLSTNTGFDMLQMFNEWADSSGELKVELSTPRTFKDEDDVWQLVFSLVNLGNLKWPHPVDVQLELADGTTEIRSFRIQPQPHLITTQQRVQKMVIDPEMKLLNWSSNTHYTL